MLKDYVFFYESGSQLVHLDPQKDHKKNLKGSQDD